MSTLRYKLIVPVLCGTLPVMASRSQSGEPSLDWDNLFSAESSLLAVLVAIVLVVLFGVIWWLHSRRLKRYKKINNQTINALNEELLRSKEEADRQNAYRGAFVDNLARELKTPLNTIDDFTAMLSNPGVNSEDVAGCGKVISLSAQKIKQAIEDITDFSKSYPNGPRLNVSDVCINDLMRDIYNHFKIIVGDRAVSLNLVLPLSDDESHITSDRNRISKIVYHLLDNSLKYTAQGKITFGYRMTEDRSNILISVNDTGIGIPQRRQMLLAYIFDSRNSDDIMSQHDKIGLGLMIAQRNAKLLQGTLTFKSVQGVGSTFTLKLPLHIDDVADESGAVIADPNYPSVLVVEAESTSFLYLRVLLERLGENAWLISHARTGDDALSLCRSKTFSMVLAGVNLSSDAGFKAIDKIHQLSATLPIVAVLPLGSKSMIDDAMNAGASDYLVKPVNRNDLMRLCRKYLGDFVRRVR